ncbi:glycoside hydrolase family 92 protein [Herbiconiux sp. CPCC 205763]|uniref:Glycoside hydrolase family 92 protein n=1 Tax=Herbiconiux aconitum TaxID=2970913 RepID=A0ABT2GL20_9MICO|nr:glycoside hydrolase domain-containing protein [Herbiconiux aconitum]MCS5716908.1 glycoside hydrolase family 92 protein [Herbiconiux aconitum]
MAHADDRTGVENAPRNRRARPERRLHRLLPIPAVVAVVAAGLMPGFGVAASASAAPVMSTGSTAADASDYTRLVDPFVSTEDDFGQDMPGAFAPHGLAKLNPMTTPGRSHTGYDYAEDQIAGFTSTNLDGVGGSGAGGDLLVVPTYVQYTTRPSTNSYAKDYSHDHEEATPGYYQVDLTTTQGTDSSVSNTPGSAPIDAQMTADVRSSLQNYTFPNAGTASLVFDLRNNYTGRNDATLDTAILPDGRASFSGFVAGGFNGNNYRLYYYAETTGPVKGIRTWDAAGTLDDSASRQGKDIGAIIDFDVAAGDQVQLNTTLSPISTDQAKTDMANEIGGRSFADVREGTKAAWNQVLSTVAVDSSTTSDPDGTLEQLFYTHLYRMFGSPVNATSTTGTYRGIDGVIYQADGYTHYDGWGLWDDFRKQAILGIAYPDVYHDVAQSLVDLFAEFANSGAGSVSSLEQSVPTVRFERASVVIADAVSKGVNLKGLDLAFAGLKKHVGGGYNDAANTARGYLADQPGDTLGTAYDDWSMSLIAHALGKTDDEAFYLNRATNYTNLFDKDAWTNPAGDEVGMIMPKDGNGNFWTNVDPEQFQAANLYQGTLWQYNWYVANDMGGMIDLMGGQKNAQSAIDYFFGEQAPDDGSRMLHSNANEIDLQAPYLFNYVGQPSHTQYWARTIATKASWNRYIATDSTSEVSSGGGEFRPPIKDKVFELDSDGFLPTQDNDTGMMSGTFVADAMGLFPVVSGSNSFQIGSPIFERMTIDLHDGRTFAINADGVSPDSFYIQSADLNGQSLDRTWLTSDEIHAGGAVTFQMGEKASGWAADGPMDYSMSDHVSSGVYDRSGSNPIVSSARVFTESDANDGTIGSTVTLSTTKATFAGANGDDLAASGAVTAENLPDGLALRATKKGAGSLELSLSGTSRIHLPSDDIDDLNVALTDSAFAGSAGAAAQTITFKVSYTGYTVSADDIGLKADESGATADQATLTLHGGATLAGATGTDLLATGTAHLAGLPAGLSATLVRQDATTLALEVNGTLTTIAPSSFSLVLDDAAFAGGVTSRQVTGDGLSSLSPFTLTVGADWHSRLQDLYDEAHLVHQGNYSPQSFAALSEALTKAKALLDAPDASEVALQQAYFTVNTAMDGLVLGEGGFRRLEGEASDHWSGGGLKNEAINLGGVTPGSWVGYDGMDFSTGAPGAIDIRYVANAGRTAPDSFVEIHADAPDGPLAGTVALPHNSPDWNNYTTVTAAIDDRTVLAGASSVYFVFGGTVTGALPFIANLDSFQFTAGAAPDGSVKFDRLDTTNATELHPGIDHSLPIFQNLNDGEWAAYSGYDFGAKGADHIQVSFDKPHNGTTEDTRVEIRLGSLDAPATATVPLAGFTGDNWGTYNTTTLDLDPTVFTGVQDVYIVFTAPTATAQNPYVANVGWLQFGSAPVDVPTSFHLEAEDFTANSGGDLGVENNTDPSGVAYTNLKGTHDGDWLQYDGIDLGSQAATSVTVRYVNNSSRCGQNSRIDVFLDSKGGEPFTTVPLPVSGNAWNAITTTTVDLPSGITGAHTVFLVLRTQADGGHPYVANIDWLEFGYGVDLTPLTDAIAAFEPLEELGDRYLAIDFRTFTQALENARAVAADPAVTTEALGAALRALNLAGGQLEWKVIRQLAELVPQAAALDPALYTPESFAAVTDALAAAGSVGEETSYDDYLAAYTALRSAVDGLAPVIHDTEAPVITLPTDDTVTKGDAFDPLAGVSATDDVDGDVTAAIVVTGTVDTATPGSYVLSYTVSDAAGNATSVQRTIVVEDTDEPEHPKPAVTVTGTLETSGHLDVVATGLDVATAYSVYLHSEPVLLGSATSDADGALTVSADIPDAIEAGEHTVEVQRADGTVVVSASIELVEAGTPGDPGDPGEPGDPGTPTDPGTPPTDAPTSIGTPAPTTSDASQLGNTGFTTGAPLVIGGLLLVAGLGLAVLMTIRRRRSTEG